MIYPSLSLQNEESDSREATFKVTKGRGLY